MVLREDAFDVWTVIPKLCVCLVSMNPKKRTEGSVLKPPDQQFVVCISHELSNRFAQSFRHERASHRNTYASNEDKYLQVMTCSVMVLGFSGLEIAC